MLSPFDKENRRPLLIGLARRARPVAYKTTYKLIQSVHSNSTTLLTNQGEMHSELKGLLADLRAASADVVNKTSQTADAIETQVITKINDVAANTSTLTAVKTGIVAGLITSVVSVPISLWVNYYYERHWSKDAEKAAVPVQTLAPITMHFKPEVYSQDMDVPVKEPDLLKLLEAGKAVTLPGDKSVCIRLSPSSQFMACPIPSTSPIKQPKEKANHPLRGVRNNYIYGRSPH